jgi:hypothetical protein
LKSHTKRALEVLVVAFPRWAAKVFSDPSKAETWGELLEDLDPAALHDAVKRLAKGSVWPPNVAEIREAAGVTLPAKGAHRLTGAALRHNQALRGAEGPEARALAEKLSDPIDWFLSWNERKRRSEQSG